MGPLAFLFAGRLRELVARVTPAEVVFGVLRALAARFRRPAGVLQGALVWWGRPPSGRCGPMGAKSCYDGVLTLKSMDLVSPACGLQEREAALPQTTKQCIIK